MASADTPMDIADDTAPVTQPEDPLPTTQTTQSPSEGVEELLIAKSGDEVPARDSPSDGGDVTAPDEHPTTAEVAPPGDTAVDAIVSEASVGHPEAEQRDNGDVAHEGEMVLQEHDEVTEGYNSWDEFSTDDDDARPPHSADVNTDAADTAAHDARALQADKEDIKDIA